MGFSENCGSLQVSASPKNNITLGLSAETCSLRHGFKVYRAHVRIPKIRGRGGGRLVAVLESNMDVDISVGRRVLATL